MACSNGNKGETNAVPNTTESSRSSSNRNNTSSAASTKKLQGDNHTSSSKKSAGSGGSGGSSGTTNGNSGDRQSSNKASSVSCTTPNAGVTASSSAVTPSEVAAIAIKQKWLENHVLSNKHKEIDSNDAVVQKLMIYYLLKKHFLIEH